MLRETSCWLIGFSSFLGNWWLLTERIKVKCLRLLRCCGAMIVTMNFILILKNFFSGSSYFVPATDSLRGLASYRSFRLSYSSTSVSSQGGSSPFETSRLLQICIRLLRLKRIRGIRLAWCCSRVAAFEDKLIFCLFWGVHLRKADVIDSELKVFPMLHDCQWMTKQTKCEIEWAFELLAVTNQHTVSIDASFSREFRWEHFNYAQVSVQLDAPTELHFRS